MDHRHWDHDGPILFLDTEWADVRASELVSLALVSDCGRFEFYAERDRLPSAPTAFVRSVIYPLLDRGDRALSDEEFTLRLHAFFEHVTQAVEAGRVLVAFDHANDLGLLNYALDGFEATATMPRPAFTTLDLAQVGILYAVGKRFERDPSLRARRHHALVDACANRDAYLDLRKRTGMP